MNVEGKKGLFWMPNMSMENIEMSIHDLNHSSTALEG